MNSKNYKRGKPPKLLCLKNHSNFIKDEKILVGLFKNQINIE